jgi:hypothetical protein
MVRKLSLAALAAACLLPVMGDELWYEAVDESRSWDNASAWRCGNAVHRALPKLSADNVNLNGSSIALPNFLRVTNGVTATAYTLRLGSVEEASYAQTGRKIALKIEPGAVLHTDAHWHEAISLGELASGYGVMTVEGGTVSNQFITVGTRGIGVLTNDCGRIISLGPERDRNSYGYLNVGFASSATGTVVMTGGTITHLPSAGGWNQGMINVGGCGHGIFELSGGVISNRLMIGTSRSGIQGAGSGVFKMSGGTVENRLFLGYKEEGSDSAGSGSAEITGGTVNGHVYVGQYGYGRLVVDGGTINIPRSKKYSSQQASAYSSAGLRIGSHAGSHGEFVFRRGELNFDDGASLVVGGEGFGSAEFLTDLTVPYLRIGGSAAGGRLVAHKDVTVTVSHTMQIGGYPLIEGAGSLIEDFPGVGQLVLTNATLSLLDGNDQGGYDNTSGQLSIGRYAGSFGVLRGCGVVRGRAANSNNVRVWMDNGQIIADGFGREASLDLNTVISIRNNTAAIPADTTNGWYAVNKGAALFPRSYFADGAQTTVMGGWNQDTVPGFVNSVGVSVSGVAQENAYLRGGVFAADRNDVHVDKLPERANVIGIWKLGITTDVSGTVVWNFSSVDLDFRYDQTKVEPGSGIALYRWDGTAWSKVAEKSADSTHRISVTGLGRPPAWDGIYDIGTFAVVSSKPGLTILLR